MRIVRELKIYPPLHLIFEQMRSEEDTVFLDSSLQNEMGRFSIIGRHPYLKLEKGENDFTVNGEVQGEAFEDYVRRYLKEHREENPTELPLLSGAVGYFSYDYGREKEGVCSRHPKEVEIPLCILNFYDEFLIEDHKNKTLTLIANGKNRESGETLSELGSFLWKARKREKQKREQESGKSGVQALASPLSERREGTVPAWESAFTKEDYMQAVQNMIDYIIEGDIYIVNMTQQLRVPSEVSPYRLFERLRQSNPSPFGGYLNYGSFQVVCASPERFLQVRKGRAETRPIKGTRKRGEAPDEDEALRRELEESEKDKSELLMIVDLERNDLNRVCRPGSVQVTELFTVETYATVFHLVANVVGELGEDMTVMDLMEAAFPGGSITGAPKLRAMELIDEQERCRRNLYTGSVGYLSLNGDCDFNIVIRTALFQDGVYHLGAGGGITFESELEFEYEETLQKAKAILEALHYEEVRTV